MCTIADTHVHLYPCHNPHKALRHLSSHLGRLAPQADRVALLAERRDQHMFQSIRDGQMTLLGVECSCAEAGCVVLRGECLGTLYLAAGRQWVSAEGIEILSLTVDALLTEFQPAAAMIRAILDLDGIPVLSWAPGKWWFRRGGVVRTLVETFGASLFLSDTTLRPYGWLFPPIMRAAERRGIRVLAGSDPFPLSGEERVLGTYATLLDGPMAPEQPLRSIRTLLRDNAVPARRIGARGSVLSVILRLFHLWKAGAWSKRPRGH